MGKIQGNIVKGWITSIVGTVMMVTSLFLWFIGKINLMWEGTIGLVLGCLLLLSPKTIEKKVSQAIGAWGGRDDSSVPDTPPEPPDDEKIS